MAFELIDDVTGLGVLIKQPIEVRTFRMDFSNLLYRATISSISAVTPINQGLVQGSVNVSVSNQVAAAEHVDFTVSGGTNNENYKIVVTVVDTAGNTLQAEGLLYVRDL